MNYFKNPLIYLISIILPTTSFAYVSTASLYTAGPATIYIKWELSQPNNYLPMTFTFSNGYVSCTGGSGNDICSLFQTYATSPYYMGYQTLLSELYYTNGTDWPIYDMIVHNGNYLLVPFPKSHGETPSGNSILNHLFLKNTIS